MSETKVITSNKHLARFSYVKLIEPSELSGKFEANVLIPKADKATYEKMVKAIDAAKEIAKAKKWGGKMPAELKSDGFQDGDKKFTKDDEPDTVYAGHWYVVARANKDAAGAPQLPFLCDKNRVKIEPKDVYSGCYGIASLNFFGYEWKGSKGIGAGLNGIQFIEDGEPLGGGGGNAANDFEEFDDEGGI